MRIVVCIKQSADGDINPFDASAYETALEIENAEIIILSMGPEKTTPFLEDLTRLGAKSAVHLCDSAFAGADTLATSYTLSLALKKLDPDFVFCGRQSVDGDTGQVGPSIAVRLGYSLVTNVISLKKSESGFDFIDRLGHTGSISAHSVVTLEKSRNLRLPGIRSKIAPIKKLSAKDIEADIALCGLRGSPTRVLKVFENDSDRRICKFVQPENLTLVIKESLNKERQQIKLSESEKKLKNIWCIGSAPIEFANSVGEKITVIDPEGADIIAEKIRIGKPDAVLWGSDIKSKALAPQVAAILNTGLCADCTMLETDGETLYMYRPAYSGNIIAKIRCETNPPMATVRTVASEQKRIVIGIGYGARENIQKIKLFADKIDAQIAATRKITDSDYLPYELQVGLTGKTVNPDVYIAVGISGAVHHIVGMKQSGTVIAINPDKNAPIFKYSDFGIVSDASEVIEGALNLL